MKRYELIQRTLSKLGGPGSGHYSHKGIPGQRGGSAPSTLVGKPGGHIWQRAQQRTGFKVVREAVKKLSSSPVLPADEGQFWHMPLLLGDKLKGFLVGNDAHASTVLGPWGRPREDSMEIKLSEQIKKPLDVEKSLKAMWASLSEEDRQLWERLNGPVDWAVDPLDMLASIVEVLIVKGD